MIAPVSRMTENHDFTEWKLFSSSTLAYFRFWNLFKNENFDLFKSLHKICDKNFFLVFSGTRNSNIAFIFSLDAVLFYKNLCLDNRIYFRALNSYIKTRMSWEKTNDIWIPRHKKLWKKFCHKFRNFMYIPGVS